MHTGRAGLQWVDVAMTDSAQNGNIMVIIFDVKHPAGDRILGLRPVGAGRCLYKTRKLGSWGIDC